MEKVDAGSKLVDEAGKTMDDIVTSVKHVADIMSEITAASQEQSSGIEEVNKAIAQMDEMTQQNAALVEQAAAAAESMQEQSIRLAQAVAVFQLGANDEPSMQHVPAPAAPSITERPRVKGSASVKAVPAMLAKSARPAIGGASGDDWEEF